MEAINIIIVDIGIFRSKETHVLSRKRINAIKVITAHPNNTSEANDIILLLKNDKIRYNASA